MVFIMKIAVAGKGGTGKSYIAACLAKMSAMHIRKAGRGGQVYAVDADPLGGLGNALGLSQGTISEIRPIFDMREYIEEGEEDGSLYLSNPEAVNFDGQFHASIGGVKYLRMAGIKHAGSGCYCHEYNFMQVLLNSMILGENDMLILDMCAGAEHLTRGAIKGVDMLLIVSEATRACIESAKALRSLGADLGIRHIYMAANKIRNEKEELLIRASFKRGELIGLVRMSEAVIDMAIGIGAAREQSGSAGVQSGAAGVQTGADISQLFFNIQTIAISGL